MLLVNYIGMHFLQQIHVDTHRRHLYQTNEQDEEKRKKSVVPRHQIEQIDNSCLHKLARGPSRLAHVHVLEPFLWKLRLPAAETKGSKSTRERSDAVSILHDDALR